MPSVKSRPRRGRPRKYGRPARPVTLTLPEDIVSRLSAIDADLGQAIVSIVSKRAPRAAAGARTGRAAVAERASCGAEDVIIVSPTPALARLAGVQLVPAGSGRALIALAPSRSIAGLELDLRDALENGGLAARDRTTFAAIADILRRARRSRRVTVEQRSIIVLEPVRARSAR